MTTEKRTYTKRARARAEEETRLRITESAVHLHGSVGPARTTISAVAELAGVRRATVYRHFPDESALFAACSLHWMAANPPPDPSAWPAIRDPDVRLHAALTALYPYYRGSERMIANLLRDEATVAAVRGPLGAYHGMLGWIRDTLMAGRGLRGHGRRRAAAAVGHALDFWTWRSLALDQGLADGEAVDLMCGLVASARSGPARPARSSAAARS